MKKIVCDEWKLFSILLLISILGSGCSSFFSRSAAIVECVGATNLKYTVGTTIGSPVGPAIVDKDKPVVITIKNLTINDSVGNDLERCILRQAGVLAPASKGTDLNMGTDISFTDEFSEEFKGAIKTAALKNQPQTISNGTEIGFGDILTAALNKVTDQFKASYIITNKMKFQSFAFNDSDKVVENKYRFTQTKLGDSVTSVPPEWEALLFRGKGFDLAEFDISLNRQSLISDELQTELDKLQKSTFIADTLSSALAAIPGLGGEGSQVGKYFGSRIDKAVYNLAEEKYGPKFAIGTAQCAFMTGQTVKDINGNSVLIASKLPEQTFYIGDRKIAMLAKLKKENDQGSQVVTIFSMTLNTTYLVP